MSITLTSIESAAEHIRRRVLREGGPEGRADAIAATFRQVASLPHPAGCAEAHPARLADAFLALSQATADSDDPRKAARARTLRELGEGVYDYLDSHSDWPDPRNRSDLDLVEAWFMAQIEAWHRSTDPRQRAMADTARDEWLRLRALWAPKVGPQAPDPVAGRWS